MTIPCCRWTASHITTCWRVTINRCQAMQHMWIREKQMLVGCPKDIYTVVWCCLHRILKQLVFETPRNWKQLFDRWQAAFVGMKFRCAQIFRSAFPMGFAWECLEARHTAHVTMCRWCPQILVFRSDALLAFVESFTLIHIFTIQASAYFPRRLRWHTCVYVRKCLKLSLSLSLNLFVFVARKIRPLSYLF